VRRTDPDVPPIFAQHSAPFQEALNQLAVYMQRASVTSSGPGVVFLLGAGCSMQYGLPGFRPLLARVYRDLYCDEPDLDEWGLSDLRARLDSAFSHQDQEALDSVARHLGNVRGGDCLAYRLLASLMRRRLVKHVVNMNFDSLLDDVCEGELTQSISRVHGSTREGAGRPVLNIEETEFFSEGDWESELKMVRLLTDNHVVSVGYSGVDAKVAHALHPPVPPPGALGERPRRLFFVAIDPPDVRFTHAMLARSSQAFTITGPEGTFENFMLGLDATLRYKQKSGGRRPKPAQPARSRKETQLTLLELAALRNCLRLALRIRAAMNVADASETGIEEHGDRLFERCFELADRSRLRLTSPEKYLLYCACYLHDLGYFRAYSGGRINAHPGWFLLRNHGVLTAQLLAEHLSPGPTGSAADASPTSEPFAGIVPGSYHRDDAKRFVRMLIELCRRHTGVADDSANEAAFRTSGTIRVAGQPLPVRFDLLAALLPTAEEISSGHPFLPSGDPIDPSATPPFVIDDPALEIYLRRKELAIRFTLDHQAIVGCAGGASTQDAQDQVVSWLSKLADDAIGKFNRRVAAHSGAELTYRPPQERPRHAEVIDLLDAALAERLDNLLGDLDWTRRRDSKGRKAKSPRPGTVVRILDLLALYALDRSLPGGPAAAGREPIAPAASKPVGRALELLAAATADQPGKRSPQRSPHEGVLGDYLPRVLGGARPGMERRFCDDVRAIYLPAWRFCAQNWRRGISPLVMASASLDLGSTPYRSEVTYGLRSLPIKLPKPADPTLLGGHGGCTLCTGRLLYVLSYARLFAHSFEHPFAVGNPRVHADAGSRAATLDPDQAVLGIVSYLLDRPAEDLLEPNSWWGIADDFRDGRAAVDCIQAADYLAAAIRGIAFCLWVDRRLRPHTRNDLLGERRQELAKLFARLWTSLCTANQDRLLSHRSEEPHSYPLGEAARTYLMVRRLWQGIEDPDLPFDVQGWTSARQNMAEALHRLSGEDIRAPEPAGREGHLSRISQFYLLPAYAFLHETAPPAGESREREALRARLVRTYQSCAGSPIWIKDGDDAGSWGYNQENTARLVLAVSCFWRHVFENPDEFEGAFEDDGTIR
jgi:hypothetical protein